MSPFVVDASMTLSWCFWDEATPHSRAVLAALQTTYAVVPALWPFEIANGLAIAERRRRISQDQIAEFLETLRRLPIQVERREAVWLCQAIMQLARDHRLTAYDAAYLDLARREQLSLATLDDDLQKAGLALGVAALALRGPPSASTNQPVFAPLTGQSVPSFNPPPGSRKGYQRRRSL